MIITFYNFLYWMCLLTVHKQSCQLTASSVHFETRAELNRRETLNPVNGSRMTTTGNDIIFILIFYSYKCSLWQCSNVFWLLCEVIFANFNVTTAITTVVCKCFASKQGTDSY